LSTQKFRDPFQIKRRRAAKEIAEQEAKYEEEIEDVQPAAFVMQNASGHIEMEINNTDIFDQSIDLVKHVQKNDVKKVEERGIPKMNICIMVVGTRGDVQPFIAIGNRLQQHGHRVRLATHAVYREFVVEHGLEFYPLGGDPKELAAYMVKTGGHLIPTGIEEITKDMPRNIQMIEEILVSTWPAVSAPDPDAYGPNIQGEHFQAHAIISNPVTYGHIHVAERLGVPLHIMFPQPWVPTQAFPHPLSNLPYIGKYEKRNYISYKLVDLLMWQGTEGMVNRFRSEVLELRKIRKGDGGRNILLDLDIPHSFMWSPHLVPQPSDWDDRYDIIGTVSLPPEKTAGAYTPSEDFSSFLAHSAAPIFVGFGSMVMPDPTVTTEMIIKASKLANVRIVIQSSWSDMAGSIEIPENVFFLGNCPHDWLMPQMAAVVHHGGAGTTAAGLLAGKPTFIVPFFGDQPFWGWAVLNAGVGVAPCPIKLLSVEILTNAFKTLLRDDIVLNAKSMQMKMQSDNGVEAAVASFYRKLPLKDMRCALFSDHIATKWLVYDQLRLCDSCAFIICSRPQYFGNTEALVDYKTKDYGTRGPNSKLEGAKTGTGQLLHELSGAVKDIIAKPTRGFKEEGVKGAVIGACKGLGGLVIRPIHGFALLADQVAVGHYNSHRDSNQRKKVSQFEDLFMTAIGKEQYAHSANMANDETPTNVLFWHKKHIGPTIGVYVSQEEKMIIHKKLNEVLKKRELLKGTQPDGYSIFSFSNVKNDIVEEEADVEETSDPLISVTSISCSNNGCFDMDFDKADSINDKLDQVDIDRLCQTALGDSNMHLTDLKHSVCKPPSMSICLIANGSWSEVRMMVSVAKTLQSDGHRVRVVAYPEFQQYISDDHDLEYYSLDGNHSLIRDLLSTIKNKDNEESRPGLFGIGQRRSSSADPPEKTIAIESFKEFILSIWRATTGLDKSRRKSSLGDGPSYLQPFRADAIICNPMLNIHTHIGQRLGVPIHLMATAPSTPTYCFPHPMSANLSFKADSRWRESNFLSYKAIDAYLWNSVSSVINDIRNEVLDLTPFRRNQFPPLLYNWRIPCTYFWDSQLLAKPSDWRQEVDVVGYAPTEANLSNYSPSAKLAAFLKNREPSCSLLYFGLECTKSISNMLERTLRGSNIYIILDCNTSSQISSQLQSATNRIFVLDYPCPKSWLFHQVDAVIHYGSEVCVEASLKCGKPSLVCPVQGMERFWATLLYEIGVSLEPMTLDMISSEKTFIYAIEALTDSKIQAKAKRLSEEVLVESQHSVKRAVSSFYYHLPLNGMLCDIVPNKLAHIYDSTLDMKLSYEADIVAQQFQLGSTDRSKVYRYKPIHYSLEEGPQFTLAQLSEEYGHPYRLPTLENSNGFGRLFQSLTNITLKLTPASYQNPAHTKNFLTRTPSLAAVPVESSRYWKSDAEERASRRKVNVAYERIVEAKANAKGIRSSGSQFNDTKQL